MEHQKGIEIVQAFMGAMVTSLVAVAAKRCRTSHPTSHHFEVARLETVIARGYRERTTEADQRLNFASSFAGAEY